MKVNRINYGARITVRVVEVIEGSEPRTPKAAIFSGVYNGQGYVIMKVTHDVDLAEGKTVVLEFTPGGPFRGYWKAVAEA